MTSSTPHGRVTTAHTSKKSLLDQVKSLATPELWLDRLNKDKSWSGLSNRQLLRLHEVLSLVKSRFGTREKLVEAVVAAHGRTQDKDYRNHFAQWPLPRLLDTLSSAERRAKRASIAASPAKTKAAPAARAAKAGKTAAATATKPKAARKSTKSS